LLVGRGVFLSTIIRVADALGVDDYRTLLRSSDPDSLPPPKVQPPASESSHKTVRITLEFDLDANGFMDPEVRGLLEKLKQSIDAFGDIEPDGYRNGSLLITADLLTNDLTKLIFAFAEGRLLKLEFRAVIVPSESAPYVLKFLKDYSLADVPADLAGLFAIQTILLGPFFGIIAAALASAVTSKYAKSKHRPIKVEALRYGSIRLTRVPPDNPYDRFWMSPAPYSPSFTPSPDDTEGTSSGSKASKSGSTKEGANVGSSAR
jgi:hypothetical protein